MQNNQQLEVALAKTLRPKETAVVLFPTPGPPTPDDEDSTDVDMAVGVEHQAQTSDPTLQLLDHVLLDSGEEADRVVDDDVTMKELT